MRYATILLTLLAISAIACSDDSNSSQGSGTAGSPGSGGSGGTPATGGSGGDSSGGNNSGGMANGGSGGMGSGGGMNNSCTWNPNSNSCGVGFYCDSANCGAGSCQPVTNTDDVIKVPVCGCDGVNYWNTVTASNHGMPVASSGECNQPFFCGGIGSINCPTMAHFCAFDVNNANGCLISDVGGACWGMPLTCNIIGFGGQQRPCQPNLGCLYECEAIKMGVSYWGPDNTCPQ